MAFSFDEKQLENLMKSFHLLTGIRFVLFDNEFNSVFKYPKENCEFCSLLKSCPQMKNECKITDKNALMKTGEKNSLVLYKCYAGLVEAAVPLYENGKTIGYLMFGQITDNPDKSAIYAKIDEWAENYSIEKSALKKGVDKITYKSVEEIEAAAKIMEACTSYIIYKELITPDTDKIIEAAKNYIETHLNEDISVDKLCKEIDVGRTRLYDAFRLGLNSGISQYILRRRLHNAKKLLKTTELSIPEIASKMGFSDYNYFSRVYKKHYGKSPKYYRKKN